MLDVSGSLISDARIDSANALIRALLVLAADLHPELALTIAAAGSNLEIVGTDVAADWRWPDPKPEQGAIGELADAVDEVRRRGAVALAVITDEPGGPAARALGEEVVVVIVRSQAGPPRPEAVLAELIAADRGDGG